MNVVGVSDRLVMSAAPARLAGFPSKGAIEPGRDAELIVWNPDEEWTVEPEKFVQRHKVTPYAGRRVWGLQPCIGC